MTAHTKGTGTKWVGRAIRRLEDPALVSGNGRFTADLPAAHWVRFVRSPIAAGKIESTTIGSSVTLLAINNTEWIATSVVGTWTVT